MPSPLDYSFLSEEEEDQGNGLDYSFLGEEEEPEKGFLESAADTVVETVSAIPKYAQGLYEGIPAAFENRREIASKITASLGSAQVGIASALGQIGKKENEFYGYDGPDELTDALNNYVEGNKGKATARLGKAIKQLEVAESKQKLTPEGEFIRDATTMGSESAGSMLIGGAAKSAATGLAAMGPQVFGQQYEQLKKEGESEAEAVVHAGAKTAIELASELLPMQKVLNLPDGVARKIADMTLIEGSTEAASSAAEDVYDTFVRDKDFDIDKTIRKATESFKLGAVSGAVIGGGVAAPQVAGIIAEGAGDTTKSVVDTFKKKLTPSTPDQTGQPSELFNPTHKAGGGVDVQVATKNGRIIPDTYVTDKGETIRDANAVANNPDESVDVTNDVSAVVASVKAEIAGKNESINADVSTPDSKANDVIASLEQQNQQTIDSAFAAPAPEAANQGIINSQIFDKTPTEVNQENIDASFPQEPTIGQQGVAPEIPVTQSEINQKQIEGFAAQDLAAEPSKTPTEDTLFGEYFGSRERVKAQKSEEKEIADKAKAKQARIESKASLEKEQVEIGVEVTKLQKENDTVEKLLARAGGLNRESMSREGVDPEEFKSKAKVFGKPLFPKKGGMTADNVAELLNEQGFRGGNLTANEALDIIFDSIDNDGLFANEEIAAQKADLDNRGDSIDQELEAIAELDAKPKRLEPKSKKVEKIVPVEPVIDKSVKKGEQVTLSIDVTNAASEAATSTENDLPEPTEAQKESGNYKKGHAKVQGFDIAIENPAGSKRRPEWPTLKQHYGYIKGTVGADSKVGATGNKIEQVDVFVNPKNDIKDDGPIFVIDQATEDGSTFDEHKVMMGFETEQEARDAYQENYTKGWKGLKQITKANPEEFKSWLKDGDTTKEYGDKILKPKQSKVKPDEKSVKIAKDEVAQEGNPVINYNERLLSLDLVHSIIDKNVFQDIVSNSIQNDGQKVLDALSEKKDKVSHVKSLNKILQKYTRDYQLDQPSGGGAGPGKVRQARRGAVDVYNSAKAVLSSIENKQPEVTTDKVKEISDPYKDMTGKEISYEVEVEETSETYTVTVDAGIVMKELDTRLDALQELRDCI